MADGSPLKDRYCYEDKDFELIGQPAGGTFSGCGMFEQGGRWYINPVKATVGVSVFPTNCVITYTPPVGPAITKNILMWKPVIINPPLEDTFTCNGDFFLNATTLYAGAYDYSWTPAVYLDNPDTNFTSGTITSSQVFKITAVDHTSGCVGSDSMLVEYKVISVDVDLDKERVCPSDTFQLRVTNPNSTYGYQWVDFGRGLNIGNESSVRYAIATPGRHQIDLDVSNEECTSTISTFVEVVDVGLRLQADPSIVDFGSSVALTTSAMVPYQVTNWYPTYLFPIQNAVNQILTPDSSRTYTVVARSAEGCVDSASVSVTVNPQIMMPSAFSPNGDGINDFFRPTGLGGDFRITTFQVYNRFGQIVYELGSAGIASQIKGWDGTINGKPAQTGTYFYYIEMLDRFGKTIKEKGDVTLVR